MLFNVQRDEAEEKVFTIRWPDTQFEFYLVLRDSGFKKAKDGVYILMDKFRREFYIGETGAAKSAGIFNRFQVHKQDKKFWDRALVITDLHDEFKQDNIRRYYEWELNRIAKERVSANQLITIHSSAGPQDKPYGAETRMETILAVCRFIGIPWAFSEDAHDKKKAVKKAACSIKPTKGLAASFQFSMIVEAGIKIGSELVFVPDGKKVTIADMKNRVKFEGETYTTSGFCKKFMPKEKRKSSNSYQGPKYFTFKGQLLSDLRAKLGK